MGKATRNIIFRLYPTRKQEETLTHWPDLHRELYNAALQERRDAYRKCGISLTYNEQQNELPAVKEGRPDLVPLGSHALQETVRRVDRAYRSLLDASMGLLFSMLAYKAVEAEGRAENVIPNGTSQDCFWCGAKARTCPCESTGVRTAASPSIGTTTRPSIFSIVV